MTGIFHLTVLVAAGEIDLAFSSKILHNWDEGSFDAVVGMAALVQSLGMGVGLVLEVGGLGVGFGRIVDVILTEFLVLMSGFRPEAS